MQLQNNMPFQFTGSVCTWQQITRYQGSHSVSLYFYSLKKAGGRYFYNFINEKIYQEVTLLRWAKINEDKEMPKCTNLAWKEQNWTPQPKQWTWTFQKADETRKQKMLLFHTEQNHPFITKLLWHLLLLEKIQDWTQPTAVLLANVAKTSFRRYILYAEQSSLLFLSFLCASLKRLKHSSQSSLKCGF